MLFECLAYWALGAWLARAGLASVAGAVAVCILVAMAVRVLVAVIPFLLVLGFRLAQGRAIQWVDFLQAFVLETWAKSISFTLWQPFERWLMPPDPPLATSPTLPILLVHGYVCNRGIWRRFKRLLADQLAHPIYTISLEPPLATIDSYTTQLAERVEAICQATGHAKLILVCHSMGGLLARHYLTRSGGQSRVALLITLASPHHGTELARFGIGRNVRQMVFGNAWLQRLAAEEVASPNGVPTISLWTDNDNLVYPPDSAELPRAKNVKLTKVGHVSMQLSAEVADLVVAEVKAGST